MPARDGSSTVRTRIARRSAASCAGCRARSGSSSPVQSRPFVATGQRAAQKVSEAKCRRSRREACNYNPPRNSTEGHPVNRTSARLAAIAESATLAVDAKAKALKAKGENVIGFGAGEPDFPTPDNIVEAAARACHEVKYHKYTPAAGLPELREAIAVKTLRDSGFQCQASQVLVTNGGKHAVFTAFAALCDPGDEVICPAPYWTTYPEAITLAGGVPVIVQTDESTGFKATHRAARCGADSAHQGAAVRQPRQPERRHLLAGRGRGDWSLGGRQGRVDPDRRDLRAPRLRRQQVRQHADGRPRARQPVHHRQRRRQDVCNDRLARRLDDRAQRRHEGSDQLPVAHARPTSTTSPRSPRSRPSAAICRRSR